MKTRLATLALPLLVLAGCADNNASVRISAICAPPDDASKCAFSSTCDAQYIGANALDVDTANQLWLFVQVDNLTPNNQNSGTFRTNTNDAFVQEYEVQFADVALPTARGPIPGSAMVPAAGTSVISLPVIDAATGTGLAVAGVIPSGAHLDIIAKVRLHGVYADTTKFVTGEFQIPIRVCNGCIPALVCAAGDVATFCPSAGQAPAAAKCVTP